MAQTQTQTQTRQEAQRTSLLRTRDEESEREQAAAAADMVAALHPQRLVGNAALAGYTGAPAAAHGAGGVAAIAGRVGPTIQTKMMLGPANDAYEQEADAVADQVVQRLAHQGGAQVQRSVVQRAAEEEELQGKRDGSLPVPVVQRVGAEEEEELQGKLIGAPAVPVVQRAGGEEEEELQGKLIGAPALPVLQRVEDEEELQGKRLGAPAVPLLQRAGEDEEELQASRGGGASADGGELLPDIEAEVNGARAGGSPLPAPVRSGMEQSFGADFGGVRIHTGGEADTLNRKLNAKAFTTGSDIFFRSGEFNPGSSGGQHLLAHELTHVVHQGGAAQVQTQRDASDPFFRS